MSQEELAKALCVKRQTISSWESNRTEPNLGMVAKLAEVLQCKRQEFFDEYEFELVYSEEQKKQTLTNDEEILLEAFRNASPEQRCQALLQLLKRGDLE